MRFLVDMPVSPRVAAWLTEEGHDAVHAVDLLRQVLGTASGIADCPWSDFSGRR